MSPRSFLSVVAVFVFAGCAASVAPARSQWKVVVATDAPVPVLGEQLRVEFLDASGNDVSPDETRLIDASRPELWPVSFGVVPATPGVSPRIRVRLYRLDETDTDGNPIGATLIDETATLPQLESGVTEVTLTLRMACFGVPPDLTGKRTCDPTTGALGPEPTLSASSATALPAPGTWAPAAVVPCNGTAPDGMTCIPGGVFLMGAASFFKDNAANDPYPEHLVQLHAFAIDNDEVTVGTIQQLVQKHGLSAPLAADPIPAAMPQECTYGNGDPSLPITCITWAQANTACQLLGKRLPTEAEYEYVAGNLGAKTPYPWGADPNVCAKAVVARGRSIGGEPEALECLSSTAPSGPVAGGAPGDVTALGVRNLAGNVAEWVADVFDAYTGPCWAGSSPFVDPSCSAAVSGKTGHVFRGGSWQVEPFLAFSYQRDTLDPGKTINVALGFRCAVDM